MVAVRREKLQEERNANSRGKVGDDELPSCKQRVMQMDRGARTRPSCHDVNGAVVGKVWTYHICLGIEDRIGIIEMIRVKKR